MGLRGGAGSPPPVCRSQVRTEPFADQIHLVEKVRQACTDAVQQANHPQRAQYPQQPQHPQWPRHRQYASDPQHALPISHPAQAQRPRHVQYFPDPRNAIPEQDFSAGQRPPGHANSSSSALLPPRPGQRQRSVERRMSVMAPLAPPQSEEALSRLRSEARRLEWEQQEARARQSMRERQDPQNIALAATNGNSGVHVVPREPDRRDPRNLAIAMSGNGRPHVVPQESDPQGPRAFTSHGDDGAVVVSNRSGRDYEVHFPEL